MGYKEGVLKWSESLILVPHGYTHDLILYDFRMILIYDGM